MGFSSDLKVRGANDKKLKCTEVTQYNSYKSSTIFIRKGLHNVTVRLLQMPNYLEEKTVKRLSFLDLSRTDVPISRNIGLFEYKGLVIFNAAVRGCLRGKGGQQFSMT